MIRLAVDHVVVGVAVLPEGRGKVQYTQALVRPGADRRIQLERLVLAHAAEAAELRLAARRHRVEIYKKTR